MKNILVIVTCMLSVSVATAAQAAARSTAKTLVVVAPASAELVLPAELLPVHDFVLGPVAEICTMSEIPSDLCAVVDQRPTVIASSETTPVKEKDLGKPDNTVRSSMVTGVRYKLRYLQLPPAYPLLC